MEARLLSVNGREYRWPLRPVVVVCLDGSAFEYIERAIAAGVAPYLQSLVSVRFFRLVESALPSFTNPNNVSIVTGVPPSVHGIGGNFFLDRETGDAVMMNDSSYLRADTILAAFSGAGAHVAVVTAKDKLRRLLGGGVSGTCLSIEASGVEVYSAGLSERALAEGAHLLASTKPDLMYLSTSDYVQHKHPPGPLRPIGSTSRSTDRWPRSIDWARRSWLPPITACAPRPMRMDGCVQSFSRTSWTDGLARAKRAWSCLLLIRTSCTTARSAPARWCISRSPTAQALADRVQTIGGVDIALARDGACRRFDLPPDRTGDLVVFSDGETVIGTRPAEHDLSALGAPLRSHGGTSGAGGAGCSPIGPSPQTIVRGTTTMRSISR
jgi:Uncharacterized proteins of the AP superfamily